MRPRDRRRLRHRVPWLLRRARARRRGPRCWPSTSHRASTPTRARRRASAVRADATVTFAALKPGLLQGGPARSGRVSGGRHRHRLPDAPGAPRRGRRRRPRAAPARGGNKWTHAVGVAAGSAGMEGAAVLCTRGAMAAGRRHGPAGRHPATPPPPGRPRRCACTSRPTGWAGPFLEATAKCKAVVIGPGLGTDPATAEEIRAVVAGAPVPAGDRRRRAHRARRRGRRPAALLDGAAPRAVLTPHDGEYARMAGTAAGRATAWRRRAGWPPATGAVVLLKGSLTAVARRRVGPGPDVLLAGAGRPSLATAGSGDVLSGIIGAFLARGSAGSRGGGPGRARARPGGGARAVRGSGRRRPARACWRGCCRSRIRRRTATATGLAIGARPWLTRAGCVWCRPFPSDEDGGRGRRWPWPRDARGPAWAEIDLAAVAHNAAVLARSSARPSCVRWSRPTATGTAVRRWPAPRWPAARAVSPSRWSTRVSSCASTASTAPVLLLSECHADAVGHRARLRPHADALHGCRPSRRSPRRPGRRGVGATVHVKVDTGMHRVGAAPEELRALVAAVVREPALSLEGVWTHLPVADGVHDEDRAFTEDAARPLRRRVGRSPRRRHRPSDAPCGQHGRQRSPLRARATTWCAAASASTATCRATAVRARLRRTGRRRRATPGHVAQGAGRRRAHARGGRAALLRPAAPAAGSARSWRPCPSATPTGCRARSSTGGYEVLIGGSPAAGGDGDHGPDRRRLRRGRDRAARRRGRAPRTPGDESITADDWATTLGTISYEVVCGVGPRMPRILVAPPRRTR